MSKTILVIDDERNMRWVLEQALEKAGYDVVTAVDGQNGLSAFVRNAVDLVLLDLKMPGQDGLSVLRALRQRSADVPMILMTAYATVPTAIEALKIGATDYIRKPFDLETVLTKVHDAIVKAAEQSDSETTIIEPTRTGYAGGFDDFIGASLTLVQPLEQAAAAVHMRCPVCIYGEQGTGRRHLATLIHHQWGNQPIQITDCQSLSTELLQTHLPLGDDSRNTHPVWQQALGGSLLLANVDAIPDSIAAPLTQQLQGYQYTPQRPNGVHVLMTASQPLSNVWLPLTQQAQHIHLPPLHQRMEDIQLFLADFTPQATWSDAAIAVLAMYDWPGNVAELERVVRQAKRLAGQHEIQPRHLPGHLTIQNHQRDTTSTSNGLVLPPEGIHLETVEQDLIRQALVMAKGNKAQMARLLGLTRATLRYRLEKYEIQ